MWRVLLTVYELYLSVVETREGYTYDLYTTFKHIGWDGEEKLAVGICQGHVSIDGGSVEWKNNREAFFPLERIDKGVSFKCEEGEASVEADKVKIFDEIGQQTTVLDDRIHAVVAAGVLERVLKENDERRHQYLKAASKSTAWSARQAQLEFNLEDTDGDTQANVTALIHALGASDGASKFKRLNLKTEYATELPESLGQLTGLQYLHLPDHLVSLPDSISQLVLVEELDLTLCPSVLSLPVSITKMVTLKKLMLRCPALWNLPDSMSQMVALEELNIYRCISLQRVPSLPSSVQVDKPNHLKDPKLISNHYEVHCRREINEAARQGIHVSELRNFKCDLPCEYCVHAQKVKDNSCCCIS